MERRALGRSGLTVSAIGLGCMGMTHAYIRPEERDDKESIATIHRAIEIGVTFLDTAEMYGPFNNEELIAKALEGKRDKVEIATKFGWRLKEGESTPAGPPPPLDSSPQNIRRAVEGSLRRLRTDHIDLLYQHRVDPTVPIEDVVGTMAEFVKQGKVRYLGLSEAGEQTIRRAHAVHPITALQSEYSLWERSLEPKIIPVLRELGIGLVPFSPLGRGFLTGVAKRASDHAAGDFRATNDPRLRGDNFDANMRATQIVRDIGVAHGGTASQVALAWLLSKSDTPSTRSGLVVVPIPGTRRRKYLEENAAATELRLSQSELKQLDDALAPDKIAGPRYDPRHMAAVDR